MERKRKTYLAGAIMDLWVKEEKKLPCNIAKMIEAMLKKVLFEILKAESKLTIEETEEEKKRLESVCLHEVIRISRTLSKKKGLHRRNEGTHEVDYVLCKNGYR